MELRLPILIFGDGAQAQVLLMRDSETTDGVKTLVYKLRPSQPMKELYDLKPEDLLQDGTIEKEYPETLKRTLNRNPGAPTIMLLCDFNGRDTPMVNLHQQFINSNLAKDKEIKVLKGERAMLWRKMMLRTSQEEKYIKQEARRYKHILALRGEPGSMIPADESNRSQGDEAYESQH